MLIFVLQPLPRETGIEFNTMVVSLKGFLFRLHTRVGSSIKNEKLRSFKSKEKTFIIKKEDGTDCTVSYTYC